MWCDVRDECAPFVVCRFYITGISKRYPENKHKNNNSFPFFDGFPKLTSTFDGDKYITGVVALMAMVLSLAPASKTLKHEFRNMQHKRS